MVGPAAPQPPTGPEGSSTQSSPLKSAGCSFPRPAPILALAASGPQVVRVQEPPPLPPPPPPREREDAATRYPAPSARHTPRPARRGTRRACGVGARRRLLLRLLPFAAPAPTQRPLPPPRSEVWRRGPRFTAGLLWWPLRWRPQPRVRRAPGRGQEVRSAGPGSG